MFNRRNLRLIFSNKIQLKKNLRVFFCRKVKIKDKLYIYKSMIYNLFYICKNVII